MSVLTAQPRPHPYRTNDTIIVHLCNFYSKWTQDSSSYILSTPHATHKSQLPRHLQFVKRSPWIRAGPTVLYVLFRPCELIVRFPHVLSGSSEAQRCRRSRHADEVQCHCEAQRLHCGASLHCPLSSPLVDRLFKHPARAGGVITQMQSTASVTKGAT
jgi:hypothetical protein